MKQTVCVRQGAGDLIFKSCGFRKMEVQREDSEGGAGLPAQGRPCLLSPADLSGRRRDVQSRNVSDCKDIAPFILPVNKPADSTALGSRTLIGVGAGLLGLRRQSG